MPARIKPKVAGSGTAVTAVLALITMKSLPATRLDPLEGVSSIEMLGSTLIVVPFDKVRVVVLRFPCKRTEVNEELSANCRIASGLPEASDRNPGPIVPREMGEDGADGPFNVNVALLMFKKEKTLNAGGSAEPPSAGSPTRLLISKAPTVVPVATLKYWS